MDDPKPAPGMRLAISWLAGNSEPVTLSPGEDRMVLHLQARRDLLVRSVRFHFTDGFREIHGPSALCLVGECGPMSGGRKLPLKGLTGPVASRTAYVRERVPHARDLPDDVFRAGIEFWKWSAGLIVRQPIAGPADFFHLSCKIEVPEGACLGFAASAVTAPCRVEVEVGVE